MNAQRCSVHTFKVEQVPFHPSFARRCIKQAVCGRSHRLCKNETFGKFRVVVCFNIDQMVYTLGDNAKVETP